jgi:hypothetical protein
VYTEYNMAKDQFSDLKNMLNGKFADLGEKKYRKAAKEIAVKESMSAGGSYVVQFANGSTFTIPSVKLAFAAKDTGQVYEKEQKSVGPNTNVNFTLTQCDNMVAYVVALFDDSGKVVYRIPEQGSMTAERASQENPNDHDPCQDTWGVQNA